MPNIKPSPRSLRIVFVVLALMVAMILALPTSSWGKSTAAPTAALTLASTDFEHYKELQQKDATLQSQLLDAQDSRISDIAGQIDRFTTITGVLGILITVLLTGFGFIGYFSVVTQAKKQAQEAADTWFKENSPQLIKELREKTTTAIDEFKKTANDQIEQILASAKAASEKQMLASSSEPNKENPISLDDQAAIKQGDEALKDKAENTYSFNDWNIRAFAAYNAGNFALAADRWDQASQTQNTDATDIAKAMFYKGLALRQLGQSGDEIKAYDALIAEYAQDQAPAMRERVAKAMSNKGVVLGELGQSGNEIKVYDALIAEYAQDQAPAMRELVAKAMSNKSVVLGELGQSGDEIKAYDALIDQYAHDQEPALRNLVAKAMLNKGAVLGQIGQSEKAIEVYDALIAEYAQDQEPALRKLVAKAMFNKGMVLCKLDQSEKAIEVYDALIAEYAQGQAPELRERVASAMFNKGLVLGLLGQSGDEIKVYDALIAEYAQDQEPALRNLVAMAKGNKGKIEGQLEQ